MDCIAYVWNIFKKEKNCYNTFMGRNFYTCFVFNSCLHLYIFYPINKQNHPEKGDFVFYGSIIFRVDGKFPPTLF